MSKDHDDTKQLETENRLLRSENQRLKASLAGQRPPLSDEAVDGIAATILILSLVTALSFWLYSMPS